MLVPSLCTLRWVGHTRTCIGLPQLCSVLLLIAIQCRHYQGGSQFYGSAHMVTSNPYCCCVGLDTCLLSRVPLVFAIAGMCIFLFCLVLASFDRVSAHMLSPIGMCCIFTLSKLELMMLRTK